MYCTLLLSYFENRPQEKHIELILKLSLPLRTFKRTPGFIEMAGEICRLFIIFDVQNRHRITKQLAGDFQFLSAFYKFFDPELSTLISSKISLINIIMFSILIVRQNTAYEYFCNMFKDEKKDGLKFLEKALRNEWNDSVLQMKVIHFTTYMFLKSQLSPDDSDNCSFSKVVDEAQAGFFFEVLENLFLKIFHDKSFSFTQNPNSSTRSVCDALSVTLKTSTQAKDLARSSNFLKKVLQPIQSFFERVGNLSSDYIRRHGEQKLKPITSNLVLLFGILFNWYSTDVLKSNENSLEVTRVLLPAWSWSGHDKDLRAVVINVMAFLSDKSVEICRNFANASCSGITFTVLQAVTKYVTNESLKSTNRSVDMIQKCLRILQNCCACSEGRSFLGKENVLSVFDRFQVFEKKMTPSCVLIYKAWLELWEVSSRYSDTVRYQNMQMLEDFCEMSNKDLSTCSWEIVRNLSFKKEFRNALINRNYFPKLANKIIENGSDEEKLLVCLTIWRLVVNNSNAKSKLKDFQVFKSIKKISKCISFSNEDLDLQKIISIILEILDS